MSHQLTFPIKFNYGAAEDGITLSVRLRSGDRHIEAEAKIDTGSHYCVFTRELGEALGFDVESGLPQRMRSMHGVSTFYGHEVTLNQTTQHWDTRRYSTGSGSDLALTESTSHSPTRSLPLPVLYQCRVLRFRGAGPGVPDIRLLFRRAKAARKSAGARWLAQARAAGPD